MRVFSLYQPDDPLLAVDVFAEHPVDFERLFERADVCEVGAVPIRIASIPDLIHLKRLADRPPGPGRHREARRDPEAEGEAW